MCLLACKPQTSNLEMIRYHHESKLLDSKQSHSNIILDYNFANL